MSNKSWLHLGLALLFFVCLRQFHVAKTGLELAMSQRLALNSSCSYIHFPSAVITGVCYHIQFITSFLALSKHHILVPFPYL